MTTETQRDVVDFLKAPSTHSSGEPVEVIETHAAFVFLVGGDAYKIKRAVRYDYLDYSTLPQRHDALLRELELNSPAAPGIYRDVVAITREHGGRLAIGGDGPPVEWVLRMNRFRTEDELIHVAERGDLDFALAEALGQSIARYHSMAEVRSGKPGSILIGQILDELGREFAGLTRALPKPDTERFDTLVRRRFGKVQGLLDSRTEAGHVRRCHGDLHLRNIVLIDGDPVPFDALEFDEELGTCDVLYDLAFLLMDLHHRGLDPAANVILNAYIRTAETDAELAGLAALPLFLGVRAAISAMVAEQTANAQGGSNSLEEDGRRYLADACTALTPVGPRLVAVGGLSGTGKTTLARALAPDVGPLPGAVHIRSDVERKFMLGVSPDTRLPDAAYAPEMSTRVYARMRHLAEIALAAGHGVIVDAAYLAPTERLQINMLAESLDVPFLGLWLEADATALFSRVGTRTGDASDADARVVEMQLRHGTEDVTWTRLDASGSVEATARLARLALEAARNTAEP